MDEEEKAKLKQLRIRLKACRSFEEEDLILEEIKELEK